MWDGGEFYYGNNLFHTLINLSTGEWENSQINGEGIFFFSQGGYVK